MSRYKKCLEDANEILTSLIEDIQEGYTLNDGEFESDLDKIAQYLDLAKIYYNK